GGKLQLWRSDGSADGPYAVAYFDDATLGQPRVGPIMNATAGGLLYFVLDDGVHGGELWRSDGTGPGTYLLKDIVPGKLSSLPRDLTPLDGRLLFTAEDERYVRRLWITDGTSGGTQIVKEIGDRASISG